ncbi:hypothetical protein F5888DRAFT_1648473 [Russula emetica]|nr:hypothetical protein F5888DRAFT_1648473 [Russula emetica]
MPPNPEHLHIIVGLPSDRVASQSPSETLPAETRDLWPLVTIYATAQGDFGGLAALAHNSISKLDGTEPDFLMEFRTKLGQRRWIESDTVSNSTVLKDELHEFDNYFQDAPTGVEQRDRVSSKDLLWHLAGAFLDGAWKKENLIKEENVRWIFDKLGWHFHSILDSRARHALWVLLLFYDLLWRLHLLQSWQLAVQAYCLRRIRAEEMLLHPTKRFSCFC